MSTYEVVSAILAGLSLVVSTVVLILLVQQLKLLSRQVTDARQAIEFSTAQAEAENLRRGRQATMEFMSGTISNLHELAAKVPAAGSDQLPAFIERAMVRDSTEFRALRDYLNYLEEVCVGVNMGVFDAEVVRRSMGGRLRRAWSSYATWIEAERRVVQPALFVELEARVDDLERIEPRLTGVGTARAALPDS